MHYFKTILFIFVQFILLKFTPFYPLAMHLQKSSSILTYLLISHNSFFSSFHEKLHMHLFVVVYLLLVLLLNLTQFFLSCYVLFHFKVYSYISILLRLRHSSPTAFSLIIVSITLQCLCPHANFIINRVACFIENASHTSRLIKSILSVKFFFDHLFSDLLLL